MLIAYGGAVCVCAITAQADLRAGAEWEIPAKRRHTPQDEYRPRMVVDVIVFVWCTRMADTRGGNGFIVGWFRGHSCI